MDVLDARDLGSRKQIRNGAFDAYARAKLVSQNFPVAEVEQILQGKTRQIDDHRIVITFSTEPVHERDTNTTLDSYSSRRCMASSNLMAISSTV
jgi:hypothetical protein